MSSVNIKTAQAGTTINVKGTDLRSIKHLPLLSKEIKVVALPDGTMPPADRNHVFTYQGHVFNMRESDPATQALLDALKTSSGWSSVGAVQFVVNTYERTARFEGEDVIDANGVPVKETVNGLTFDWLAKSEDLYAEELQATTHDANMELVKRKVLGVRTEQELSIA